MNGIHRIGVMTAGGDCPGLNAVIRAVTKPALAKYNLEVVGIEDGFLGLIENRMRRLRQRVREQHPDGRRHHPGNEQQDRSAQISRGRERSHRVPRCDRPMPRKYRPKQTGCAGGYRGRRVHVYCVRPCAPRRKLYRRAQNHRQRSLGDGRYLRFCHCRIDRDGRFGSRAHDSGQPPSRHRRGSHGKKCRLDCASFRDGQRIGCDPDPGDPVRFQRSPRLCA